MEYTLRAIEQQYKKDMEDVVLILVVMEYTLREILVEEDAIM